jgi:hypothetical protein
MSLRAVLARPVPAALGTAVLLLPALVAMTVLSTSPSAAEPIDFSLFGPAGAALLTGRWASVFADPFIQAGPFELAPWGLLQLLGVSGRPAWTVAITGCAALTAFLAALVLRPTLAPDLRSSVLAGCGTLLLVLTGPVVAAWHLGHPSETLVPLLWAVAGRFALRGRPGLAAALVAASSGFEVWGLLGAPVVLLAADRRVLRPLLTAAAVLAALWVPFVVVGPFRMFSYTWGVSDGSLLHLLHPGTMSAPWSFRLVQAVLAVAAGSAVALLLRGRAWGPWAVIVAVVAARLVLDPVLAGYYWEPVLVAVTGALVLAVHRRALVPALVAALCLTLGSEVGPPVARAAALVAITLGAAVALHRSRSRPRAGHPASLR